MTIGKIVRLLTCLLPALLFSACGEKGKRSATTLNVQFTADVNGRLEPCGCFTGQYGGLTRIRTYLNSQAPEGSLRLDVGDALAGTEDYHQIQHGYLGKAFADLGFRALNLGRRESQLPAEELATLINNCPVPMVGANLVNAETGLPLAKPWITHEHNGHRIGIIGLLGEGEGETRLGEGLQLLDPRTTLTNLLPEVVAASDFIILLAFTDIPGMRELAENFYEIDLILGGDVGQPSQELLQVNQSAIVFTTNQARAVGLFDCQLQGDGTWSDPTSDVQLIKDDILEDPDFIALSRQYRKALGEATLDIDDPHALRGDEVPGVSSHQEFAGSASCAGCHLSAFSKWQGSAHAHAFESLLTKDSDMDPNCIGCHTVGFGEPSGYQRKFKGEQLASVGCESCHGPGATHVAERSAGGESLFKFRPLGEGDCKSCHHGEFSRPFHWDDFWPLVEHGKEAVPTTTGKD